jgi:hypothetical protein
MRPRVRSIALVAATMLVTVAVHAALGASSTVRGQSPSRITVVRARALESTTAQTFRNIPGVRTRITVPSGQRGLVVVRFSGQAGCASGVATAYCSIRIFVGGKQAQPKTVGAGFVFLDSEAGGRFGSYALERSRGGLSPGTYTVRVQWRSTSGAEFSIKNWHLTAEVFEQ